MVETAKREATAAKPPLRLLTWLWCDASQPLFFASLGPTAATLSACFLAANVLGYSLTSTLSGLLQEMPPLIVTEEGCFSFFPFTFFNSVNGGYVACAHVEGVGL